MESRLFYTRLLVLNLILPSLLAAYSAMSRAQSYANTEPEKIFLLYLLWAIPLFGSAMVIGQLSLGYTRSLRVRNAAALVVGGAGAVIFGYFYLAAFADIVWQYFPWLSGGFSNGLPPERVGWREYLLSDSSLILPVVWIFANFLYETAVHDPLYFVPRSKPSGKSATVVQRERDGFPTQNLRSERIIILYLAFPLALSIFIGLRGNPIVAEFDIWMSVLLIASFTVPFYLLAAFLTHVFFFLLRPVGWPPATALVAGGLSALALGFAYTVTYVSVISSAIPVLATRLSSEGMGYIDGTIKFVITPTGTSFVPIWLALHFVYEWGSRDILFFRSLAKQDVEDLRTDAGQTGTSIFLGRVPTHLRRGIAALVADEHYVHVYSQGGEGKVLYRFGDAAKELEALGLGLRVHRSYWVAKDSIEILSGTGRSRTLDLSNGMSIPVSKANLPKVQAILDGKMALSD